MRKYRGILIAAAAAVMLCACAGKTDGPAKEKVNANTEVSDQKESRKAEIQILDETPAATEPETGAQESLSESAAAAGEEGVGQETGETKTAGQDAVRETEAVKVYQVEAFEKTMYATANVNVRANYTTKSEVLASLKPGQKVKVTGRSANGWMRVIYEGRDAYVYQKYLSDSGAAPAPDSTLGAAPDVTTYPGNLAEDPPKAPGEIPIVEPAPVMTAPNQGGSVTQSGPGIVSPGGGSGRMETAVPGTGPGM